MARVKLASRSYNALYLNYSISEPDYVNARYTVTLTLQAARTSDDYGDAWNYDATGYLTGVGSFDVDYDSRNWKANTYHNLKSVSIYIGFGKSKTITGKLDLSGTTVGKLEGTHTLTMKNPNRLSAISDLPESIELGEVCEFTLTEVASELVTDVAYEVGDVTGTMFSNTAGGTKKWTVPTALATEFDTHSIECTITVSTYAGSTLIGSNTYTLTLEFIPGYIFDGSEWRKAIPYVYDGTGWVESVPYVHNGSKWAA